MRTQRFYVNVENVEELISKMKTIYTLEEHDIRAFFGGWIDESWVFEPEWFVNGFESFEDLCIVFEDWLYEQ